MLDLDERRGQAKLAECQRALRALLQQPLITAQGATAVEFGLIRKHAAWLRDWLAQNVGWSLEIDSELVRLRKSPSDLRDGTRPARDKRSDAAFSRRRYALLCLALAVLERSDRQMTLGKLAEEIELAANDRDLLEAGFQFDLANFDHRRDLVLVIRFLQDWQVLTRIHGDEQQFLTSKGDALYNVNRPALAGMLNVRRGPSTIDARSLDQRLAAIVEEPQPDTDEARRRRLRFRLTRKLLDDPVVYYHELSAEELDYLQRQRSRMIDQIHDMTGLLPELRREGIAMVDERGDLTDLGIPEEGTDGHVTLLLAEFLAEQLRSNPEAVVSRTALHQHLSRLIDEHRGHWRKSVTEPGAEIALAEETVDRLVALRLCQRTEEGVRPLPPVARYSLRAEPPPAAKRQPLLLEDEP